MGGPMLFRPGSPKPKFAFVFFNAACGEEARLRALELLELNPFVARMFIRIAR